MDVTFTKEYKNTTIEVVVEDDLITTTKVIRDGVVEAFIPLKSKDNEDGCPLSQHAIEVAYKIGEDVADEMFNKLLTELGLEPMVATINA
jgi:hypothetical protein